MASRNTGLRLQAELRRRVDEHGWAVEVVGSACVVPGCQWGRLRPEDDVDFGYTVGLCRFDHPELIVTGLPQTETAFPLDEAARLAAAGYRLSAGNWVELYCYPYLAFLLAVEPAQSARYLLGANRLYRKPGGPPVAALQLVWPDVEGWLPWEEEYAMVPEAQPLLGLVPT